VNSRKTFNRRKLLALLGAAGITAAVEAVLPVGRAAAAAAVSKQPEGGQPGLYDVSAFGAAGDGGTPDTVALKAALEAAAGSGGGSIYFPAGMYLLDESVTLPENVDLEFAPGACLYLASEVVITINGRLIAGMHQIFAASGLSICCPSGGGPKEITTRPRAGGPMIRQRSRRPFAPRNRRAASYAYGPAVTWSRHWRLAAPDWLERIRPLLPQICIRTITPR